MRVSPKTMNWIGRSAVVGLPVGYIVYEHVAWQRHPQAKKQMLTHQAVFWLAMGVSIWKMHQLWLRKASNLFQLLPYVLLPVVSFPAGAWLGRKLFPYNMPHPNPTSPSLNNNTAVSPSSLYFPNSRLQSRFYPNLQSPRTAPRIALER